MNAPAVLVEEPAPRIDPQALAKVETEGSAVEQRAKEIEILTAEDHEQACTLEREWADHEKQALALVEPACEASHRAWKANVALRDRLAGAFERARRTLKAKLGAWRETERRRIEDEARLARAAAQRVVEEEALERAQRYQDAGRPAAAEAALTILPAAPVVTAARPPAPMGVNVRKTWSAEVTDFPALIKWVAENPAQRSQYLLPAMPALNAQAKAMKEVMNSTPAPIPGVTGISRFC